MGKSQKLDYKKTKKTIMRKSAIAMLIALSFAAVSCGEPKITYAETTEEGVETTEEMVEVETAEEVVEVEATEEAADAPVK